MPAIDALLQRHKHDGTRLVQILREAQEQLGWLAPETLQAIAAGTGRSVAQVRSTAAFYRFFNTTAPVDYGVLFSDNITDRMLGSEALLDQLCRELLIERGHRSEEGLVSVDTTSCTGLCDQGPALLVNGRPLTRMNPQRITQLAGLIRERVALDDWPPEFFRIDDNVRRAGALLNHGLAPGEALHAALAHPPAQLLQAVRDANMRGRGGAGFATADKWQACRDAPGHTRYVVCNADEGEPGTFKDRVLLKREADLVFEGMTLAGYAIGAARGLLYLRGEYRYLLDHLEAVLQRRRDAGLLGAAIDGSGFDFDIEIHVGAGAYICGEESALIESLEGKPGKPRIRPPFPVTHGYLGQPTVVNNVETLAQVCLVALHGGSAWRAVGTAQSSGSKLLSISGDCARPGIYEYPFGITIAEVLKDCGAENTQAVQISGPAGMTLGTSDFHRHIAFEDVPTAGAFMIFDTRRDMFDMARNFAHFFAHESCGFCTPCRVGTAINARLMDKIADGHGSPYDIDELVHMHHLMQGASHCGLGNSAANALHDTLIKFRPAYERRLHSQDYEPGFNLDAALSEARRMTGRDDPGAHLANTEEAE